CGRCPIYDGYYLDHW
nr:immunoglobulin heavy chain junction region [Mus musculus]